MNPVFFILVSLVVTSVMLSIIFYLAWQTQGRQPHALSWAITFGLSALQWVATMAVGWFPSFESYWLVVNGLALAAVVYAVRGHCLRVNMPMRPELLWGIPAILLASIAWYSFVQPHVGIRMAIGPAYAAGALSFCAVCILRHADDPTPAEWGSAITLILFALTQIGAAVAGLMQGATLIHAYFDMYLLVYFIALPGAFTGMGLFVVFMMASDLSTELKQQAVHDQLTGLLNRRGFNESAAIAYAAARRTGRPVSVIMTDIDRFKSINDQFGHSIGDEALAHFATVLADQRRGEDILARVGGEEFALVLPGTTLADTIGVATELCQRLEDTPLQTEKGELTMTASFGVATISDRDSCLSDIVVRADNALYRSKDAGRNRVDLESSQNIKIDSGLFSALKI